MPAETESTPEREDLIAPGARVGRFSVLSTLGSGGMGVVYAAYDPELDRRIAIKVLSCDHERSRAANLRLLREAQAMARLQDPNVVAVHDVGELDGRTVFLAMEHVAGRTLDQWLDAEPRSWAQIRDVLVQAGRGLAAAHRSGLIHRDFKPSNVLVDADDRARVTDFGIARLGDDDGSASAPVTDDELSSGITPLAVELTRTGATVGTPAYMAPEQHRGAAVDARSDQFAFCVTAWEALYGERPFAREADDLLAAIDDGRIAGPRGERDVPAWLEQLLRRGLAADPAERWPSMDALLEQLADDPQLRRRRHIALAAALVAVAGAAGATSWALAGDRTESDPTAVCKTVGNELADVWTPDRRAAGERAFQATGSPLAVDHWKRVSEGIESWGAEWRNVRTEACVAHARHEQSDELYDRRVICLDRQRDRLNALVDLLGNADAAMVRESVMAVATLPPTTDCADSEALLAQQPPPEPPLRDAVAGGRADIERSTALRNTGRYSEALELLLATRERVKDVDYAPLQAELQYTVGQLQTDVSDAGAEASLRSAADLAARARDQTLYAMAWSSLVWEVGFKRARFDDAAPLRAIAHQAVALTGDDPKLAASLNMHEGAIDYIHGDKDKAVVAARRAVELNEKAYGKDSVQMVAPLNLLSVILGSLREYDDAIDGYERAIGILERNVSPQHPRIGSMLSSLASIAFDQGRFEDAADYHRRALAILESAFGPDSPDLAPTLNGLAQPLWALGRFDEAYELIDRARALWEKHLGPDHPYVAVALTNLGGLRQEQGRCREALPQLERAEAIKTAKLAPEHPSLGLPLQFHAACLIDLDQAAQAIPLLERALRMYEADGTPVQKAGVRFELARALWNTRRDRRRAIAMAQSAREVFEADPADQAQAAAGARSSSAKIADWLSDKRPPP